MATMASDEIYLIDGHKLHKYDLVNGKHFLIDIMNHKSLNNL